MADQMALADSMLLNVFGNSSALSSLGYSGKYYLGFVPQGKPLPAVRFGMLNWLDAEVIGMARCFGSGIAQVAVVNAGRSLADVRPAFNAIDTELGGVTISFSGLLWVIKRTEQFHRQPVVEGKEYTELGGMYRVQLAGI